MSLLVAVKIFCDLCVYFAAIGAVGSWFGEPMVMLLPGLLCAIGIGLFAEGERRRVLRIPGLLLPLTGFLLAGSTMDVLLLFPAVLYTVLAILLRRFALEYGDYYDYFFKGLAVLGAILLFSLLDMDSRPVLFYGALYILFGFFLLRQLRLGNTQSWRSKALNLVSLLSTIAVGGGICFAVWGIFQLRTLLGFVLRWFLTILEYILKIVFAVLTRLFELLSKLLGNLSLKERTATQDSGLEIPEAALLEGFEFKKLDPTWFYVLLTCLLIAAAGLIIWRALKGLTKTPPATPGRETRMERAEASGRLRRAIPGSPREKVRSCYRKFLLFMLDRGAEITPAETTGEIYSHTLPLTDPEASSKLRRLYLAARYDEQRPVTAEQAKEAKDLLKTLRNSSEI